jgi:hypothetical protein
LRAGERIKGNVIFWQSVAIEWRPGWKGKRLRLMSLFFAFAVETRADDADDGPVLISDDWVVLYGREKSHYLYGKNVVNDLGERKTSKATGD